MEHKIGTVIEGVGGLYTVALDRTLESAAPAETVTCRARGALKHGGGGLLVGDRVSVSLGDDGNCGGKLNESAGTVIDAILPRRNGLIRPPIANLDMLFVMMAVSCPEPSLPTVDKLLAICEHNGIDATVIISKIELDRARADEIAHVYSLAGYRVFPVSCYENEGVGAVDSFVRSVVKGRTVAFAGASGIGKSTLINGIFPSLGLETGEISRKTERGKHTTRSVRLFPTDGGFVADTPGFSMLDFTRFDFFGKEDLPLTFREFSDCIGKCRYTKCTHTKEEGCAVLEKLKNGQIAPSRHESFTELYGILKEKHEWSNRK